MSEFVPFQKIPRLSRNIVITEKIDGTNAQVVVGVDGSVRAGSRSRWITPDDDNYGFARWVAEHEAELRDGLGIGQHFGEWWGSGIQRRYGLTGADKRFSLFNAGRWTDDRRPACCHVVPTLYVGPFNMDAVQQCLDDLVAKGSAASPGFMDPEGIIVFHSASNELFKKTIKKDAEPKGLAA